MLSKGRRHIIAAFTYFFNLFFPVSLSIVSFCSCTSEWVECAIDNYINKNCCKCLSFYLAACRNASMQSDKGEEGKKARNELHPLYFYLISVLLRGLSENPTQRLLLINRAIAGGEDAGLTVMHKQYRWMHGRCVCKLTYCMCEYSDTMFLKLRYH